MEKPDKPADNACCESGCEPCVWDTYYAELSEWNAWQRQIEPESTAAVSESAAQ